MKLSEQRTLLRLSPVTIALCEIFPAKLHMMCMVQFHGAWFKSLLSQFILGYIFQKSCTT